MAGLGPLSDHTGVPRVDLISAVDLNGDGKPDLIVAADTTSLALLGDGTFVVSVDGRPVDGCDSAIPVTTGSRIVLYRRHGPMLDVLNRGVVRRICLN